MFHHLVDCFQDGGDQPFCFKLIIVIIDHEKDLESEHVKFECDSTNGSYYTVLPRCIAPGCNANPALCQVK